MSLGDVSGVGYLKQTLFNDLFDKPVTSMKPVSLKPSIHFWGKNVALFDLTFYNNPNIYICPIYLETKRIESCNAIMTLIFSHKVITRQNHIPSCV